MPDNNDVKAQPTSNLMLYNVCEELVRSTVKDAIQKMDMCTCDKCMLDACAMVLNEMLPKYVTSPKGVLYSRISDMSKEQQIHITVRVASALKSIKESPRH